MNFHSYPNTFVAEVNLKVENIERSLTFYQEVIGFQILERTEKKVKLTANGKTALLSIEQPDNAIAKQQKTTGLYHFALLLPERSDLGRVLQHLIKRNVRLGAGDHLVSEALYLDDPDGNGIEIYSDRPSSTWKWNNNDVEMTTDPIDAQGILEAGKGEAWGGLPAGTVMGHIHLQVSELQKIEEFYVKGLGFNVVARYGPQALFISTGKYHHHIGLNTWAGVGAPTPPENSVGLNWYSLVLPSKEARQEAIVRLEKIGTKVTEENGKYFTADPSGNRIKLLV
ncbi:VOC family protein [Neobacillus sp. FSL H8-0543]|uniref:VOC family protein n=1 Tax=Neobacillus sp. FSL H8-0543 TaxID=2954672 RepID=UPI0031590BB9